MGNVGNSYPKTNLLHDYRSEFFFFLIIYMAVPFKFLGKNLLVFLIALNIVIAFDCYESFTH